MTDTLCSCRKLAAFPLAMLLSACAAGPDYVRPAAPDVKHYTSDPLPMQIASAHVEGGEAQQLVPGQDVPADWWTLFSSDSLNDIIREALRNNPDLKAANASLRQAVELVYADEGAFFPAADLDLSAEREKVSSKEVHLFSPPRSIFNLYNASVQVSYNLDVFGGIRREVESAQALADMRRFQLNAAYLSLVGNVITALVQEAALQQEINETQSMLGTERQQMGVLQQQLKQGTMTRAAVLSQQATLTEVEASIPVLQNQMAQMHDEVTILMGHFPEYQRETISLAALRLPTKIPLSLPSRLVEQRPDIRAAEEIMHEANAQVGIATANMLPQINLTAAYGTAASHTNNLFSPEAAIWNIGAGLMQPIFRGGELLHEKRAAVAAYDAAASQYQSTVLLAFKNVADVLHALQYDAVALQRYSEDVRASSQQMGVIKQQLQIGSIGYLSLIDAERTYLRARLSQVQMRANRITDTVALFVALGGGWWNHPAPAENVSAGTSTPASSS